MFTKHLRLEERHFLPKNGVSYKALQNWKFFVNSIDTIRGLNDYNETINRNYNF